MARIKDISGQKFGKLIALEIVGRNNSGNALWKCKCDCGNETIVISSSLRYGNTKSCGCLRKWRFKNLIGKKFGRLHVINASPNRNNRTYWICKCECSNEVIIASTSLMSGKTRSCGCLLKEKSKLSGPNSHGWKGGKIKQNGYVMIYNGTGKYIFEHILIMEKHLDRKLLPGETVHHKNGVKDDNRIKNLELWNSRHPKGQRITDKIKFAVQLLKLYKPEFLTMEKL